MIIINNFVFNSSADKLNTLVYGSLNGTTYPLLTDNQGKLIVSSNSSSTVSIENFPLTAFGDGSTTILTPLTGWSFNYTLFTDLISTTIANGGSTSIANSMISLNTGTIPNGSSKIETTNALRYSPGLGALIRLAAIFTKGASNSTQIIGIGDTSDGFFFGYNGTEFGVSKRRGGIDEWIPKSDWNVDKLDGSGPTAMILDTTKGNVYQIQYQWLGFGIISFYVENPTTGKFALVHQIQYANLNILPSVYNPTLPLMAEVKNSGNNTNLILYTSSAMAFVQGDPYNQAISSRYTYYIDNFNIASNVQTSIFTLRNRSTFNGKANKIRVIVDFISLSTDGTKLTDFFFILNPTLTGGTFTNINTTQSVMEYSIAPTAPIISGGKLALFLTSAARDTIILGSGTVKLALNPGDSINVQAKSTSGSTLSVSLSWIEFY